MQYSVNIIHHQIERTRPIMESTVHTNKHAPPQHMDHIFMYFQINAFDYSSDRKRSLSRSFNIYSLVSLLDARSNSMDSKLNRKAANSVLFACIWMSLIHNDSHMQMFSTRSWPSNHLTIFTIELF